MDTVTLYDAAGTQYAVPGEILQNPPAATGPTRQLRDAAGRVYDLPAELFADDPAPAPQPGAAPPGSLPRSIPPNERQLQIFLENTGLPEDLQKTFWALGHQLALTKLTSQAEYDLVKLKIENLIRLYMIEGLIDDEAALLITEMLEFWAGDIELRRSITFDGKPNERELWTIQGVHQKIEQVPAAITGTGGGGILQAAFRALKGGGGRR